MSRRRSGWRRSRGHSIGVLFSLRADTERATIGKCAEQVHGREDAGHFRIGIDSSLDRHPSLLQLTVA
jgi:hypothetical protein